MSSRAQTQASLTAADDAQVRRAPQIALTTLAGTPATSVAGGTSRVTTAPAVTTESAPTVTPGVTVAAAPIQTFVSTVIGAAVT